MEIGALIAADPALSGPALDALAASAHPVAGGDHAKREPVPGDHPRYPLAAAAAAVTAAAEAQAAILAALPDPDLAQRAGDVRQVASGGHRLAGGRRGRAAPARGRVHPGPPRGRPRRPDPPRRRRGTWPARSRSAAAPARTRRSSPAASACRCWPGADPAVLAAPAGQPAVLDGRQRRAAGRSARRPTWPRARAGRRARAAAAAAGPGVPGAGADRRRRARHDPVQRRLRGGDPPRPGQRRGGRRPAAHRDPVHPRRRLAVPRRPPGRAAARFWGCSRGKRAVVRLLDFTGDKIPPFPGAEGLPAFLRAPGALAAQLAAILAGGRGHRPAS